MELFDNINSSLPKPDLDQEGYCLDCKVNHNCLSCDVMNYIIKFRNTQLKIIEPNYNENNKRYCGCGNIIDGGNIMCKECYNKNKISGDF